MACDLGRFLINLVYEKNISSCKNQQCKNANHFADMPPKGFKCKQCGHCCLNLRDAFSTCATDDDVKRLGKYRPVRYSGMG